MMVIFFYNDDRYVDSAIIERLAKKLELHSIEDLNIETLDIRNLVAERKGQHAESTCRI